MSAIEQYTQAVVHTCLVYTVELFPDRIQLLQELPRQCHIGHCWGNQTVPLRTKNRDSTISLTHSLFSPDTLGSRLTTSSITICPVMEARSENFPSILGADKPLIPWERRTSCEDMCESYRVYLFKNESSHSVITIGLSPHHKHICYWRVSDPINSTTLHHYRF